MQRAEVQLRLAPIFESFFQNLQQDGNAAVRTFQACVTRNSPNN